MQFFFNILLIVIFCGFSFAEASYQETYPPFTLNNCAVSNGYDRGLMQLKTDKNALINNCIKNWSYSQDGWANPNEICPERYQEALNKLISDKQKASQLFDSIEMSMATVKYIISGTYLPDGSDSITVRYESPSTTITGEDYIFGGYSFNPKYMNCDQNANLQENDPSQQYIWYSYVCFHSPGESPNGHLVNPLSSSKDPLKFAVKIPDQMSGKKRASLTLEKLDAGRGRSYIFECDYSK